MPRKTKKKKVEEKKPIDTLYSYIETKIVAAKNDCATWRANQLKWHKLRMRIKKTKSFPFHGCANLRLPTVETKLRKGKANIAKLIFGVRPVVQAVPSPSGNLQTAKKIEKFLDHLIMDVMQYKSTGIITIDQTMERGFFLNKPYWRVETITRMEEYSLDKLSMKEAMSLYAIGTTAEMVKKALIDKFDVDMHDLVADQNEEALDQAVQDIQGGKTEIKLAVEDVIYNAPDVAPCNPEFIHVYNDTKWHPQSARMIDHELYLPYDTVKRNVKLKNWSAAAVAEIDALKGKNLDNLTEQEKSTREGIERINNPSQLVRIDEVYLYYDLNGEGEQKKCLITVAPEFKQVLRKMTLDTFSGKVPFVKFVNELIDDRWFSHRGFAEWLEDLVKEIDTQHNQKLDSQTWRNTPMFSYRAGVVNPNLIKPIPGQAIGRHDPDDIVLLQNTNLNADFSYEKEQMILESKIEELVGQVDYTLQSMINKRQPRTLGEVDRHQQSANMVFSLDADLYITSFSELFTFIWELWCQHGDDEVEFAYFGQNGWEKIKLTKEEAQGKYKITIRGNDQNFSPQVRQQKAQMILADTYQALQLGLVDKDQANNARRRFYQELDIQDYDQFVPPQPPQLPPPPPQVKMGMDDLTPREQAQVKSKHGIQPDSQGMAMKKEEEINQQDFENRVEAMKAIPKPESPKEL